MNDENQTQKCSVCHGTGISKPKFQNINEHGEDEELEYQPLECQHCNGTGIEPE